MNVISPGSLSPASIEEDNKNRKQLEIKPTVALLIVGLLWFMQQMIINGLTSTVISTVERRFQLQSTESGLIVGVYDIFRAVGLLILLIPAKKISKPLWLALSAFTIAVGTLLFAVPHFTAPEYTYTDESVVNYCGNVTQSDCGVTNVRNFRYLFMCAMAFIGMGSSLVIVQGITYLDENVTKEMSAFYSSMYFLAGAMGPAVGYASGGSTLRIFVDISRDVEVNTNNPNWVGAWWLLYAVSSALLVLLAPMLALLPRKLANTHWKLRNNSEVYKAKEPATWRQGAKFPNGNILLCNPTLLLSCLSNAVTTSVVLGFNTFGVKYAESQFGLSTTFASYVFGGSSVLFYSMSQVTSGLILSKYKFGARSMQKYTIVCSFFAIVFSSGFLIHCADRPFAGGNIAYGKSLLIPGNLSSSCNSFCGCSTDRYQPVIDNDRVLYFSPCHAGCAVIESNGKIYDSCHCLSNDNQTVTTYQPDLNLQSYCPRWKTYLFILFAGLCMFSSGLSLTPLTQITLRCVRDNQRPLALGLQQLLSIICGTVPGRILTGKVIDSSCIIWSTKCNERGSCKFYNRWEMAKNVSFLLIFQGIIVFVFNLLMYGTYRNAKEVSKVKPAINQA